MGVKEMNPTGAGKAEIMCRLFTGNMQRILIELPNDPSTCHNEQNFCRMNTAYDPAKQKTGIAIPGFMREQV